MVDPSHVERLGAFVCSYLKYLRVPVKRVLDLGCGIGLWRDALALHFPGVAYRGVEYSEFLCTRYGWERGSVVDYRRAEPFDLVICQGALYEEAVTRACSDTAPSCTGAAWRKGSRSWAAASG